MDAAGKMYRGNGEEPEQWFGFGVPVLAPAAGRVVALRNGAPDRGPKKIDWARVEKDPLLIGGNYVILDHGHGEYSALFHLQQGSVGVQEREIVRQGQPIARMGFSGDAFTVHLHYQLQAGPEFDVEGSLRCSTTTCE